MEFNSQSESHFECSVNYYQEEVAANVKKQALEAMKDIHGMCSQHRASFLIDLIIAIQPQTVVEIGVYGGKSLIPMAFALRANGSGTIYGIDPWNKMDAIEGTQGELRNWLNSLDYEYVLYCLNYKMEQYSLQNQIQLVRSTAMDAPAIPDIDILLFDRYFSEEDAYIEFNKWVPLVKSGGIIIVNNVSWAKHAKVNPVKATEWLNQYCAKQAHFGDGNEWAIWLKL